VIEHFADAVPHHRTRPGKVFRAGRQAPDHEHEAPCLESGGIVDRAPIVVDRRLARLAVCGRKHASAAKARHREAVPADCPGCLLHAHLGELGAPGRNAADAVTRAALDHLAQVPFFPHRGGVERKEIGIWRMGHTLTTFIASRCIIMVASSTWELRNTYAFARLALSER